MLLKQLYVYFLLMNMQNIRSHDTATLCFIVCIKLQRSLNIWIWVISSLTKHGVRSLLMNSDLSVSV